MSTRTGEPTLILRQAEVERLVAPFRYILIGKFLQGKRSMEALWKEFRTFDLRGNVSLGWLDCKHVRI
jgi:hypothetical protein